MFKVGDRVWVISEKRYGIVSDIEDTPQGLFIHIDNRHSYVTHLIHQTAQTMFEELGYSKSPNSNELYIVVMDYVEFDLETKTYLTSIENITPQLHQAIHQKLIELGWL